MAHGRLTESGARGAVCRSGGGREAAHVPRLLGAIGAIGVTMGLVLGDVALGDSPQAESGGSAPAPRLRTERARTHQTEVIRIDREGRLLTTVRRVRDDASERRSPAPAQGGSGPLVNGDFSSGLAGWTAGESGGGASPGSVILAGGQALLREGDSFLVTLEQTFVIPAGTQALSFQTIVSPGFDGTASGIHDAFEATLLDAQDLQPVVPPWHPLATSFFNMQEDESVHLGSGTSWNGTTVTVDLGGVPAGTEVVLFFDLIGGDVDTQGGVRVDNVEICSDDDLDGVSSCADNCPGVSNPNQANLDGDPRGDVCDCAPMDPSAFEFTTEVRDLAIAPDKTTLAWTPQADVAGPGTLYDVPRGLAAELPVGAGPSEICLQSEIPTPSTTDTAVPETGEAFWYLVRACNVCGASTYGYQSDGVERTTAVCPGPPPDVGNVRWLSGGTSLTWDAVPPGDGTVYDVVRGRGEDLPVGPGGGDETCLAQGVAAPGATDMTAPPTGIAFWYLVRARDACGPGTYGRTSAGSLRGTTTCGRPFAAFTSPGGLPRLQGGNP